MRRTFTGIPSGDQECWCLLVDVATFRRVQGREPDPEQDVGPFAVEGSPYRYKVYPSALIPGGDFEQPKDRKPVRFTIDIHDTVG